MTSRTKGRLAGNVVLIAGAGPGGIGGAAARLFASEGARRLIAEKGEASAEEAAAAGGEALFVQTGVTDEASVREAVARATQHFGALHVLFKTAGGSLPEDSLVTDVDLAVWDRTAP
jgi:NAD(P)-dependent dehydrogenase (short-subunit alcohol dehydrogenase family)